MTQETDAGAAAVAERADTAVYVYGVARRGSAVGAEIQGVSDRGAPVRAIEGGDLAALVSDVPADWHAASRQDVAAHDRVLSELMGERTVIPMRFGIVLASDAAVRERLLQRHAEELAGIAQRLEGCEQMSVKAYYHEEALLRGVLARYPEFKQRADELERRPVPETQVDAGASDRHLTTVHLLVRRERRPELDAAVKRLSEEHAQRLALRYVGPLPPYSFTAFALEEQA